MRIACRTQPLALFRGRGIVRHMFRRRVNRPLEEVASMHVSAPVLAKVFARTALAAATLAMASATVQAQRYGDERGNFRQQNSRAGSSQADVPGRFDYYALVLSWSPTHCLGVPRGKRDPQCDPRGRRFAFVLHGLWPQYERGFPNSCRTREKPFVPQRTIDKMRDIMPSPGLTIHEYRKHGTCSGMGPEAYYDLSRRLFDKVKVPPRFRDPTQQQMLPTRQVIDEFLTANPKLKPDMMAIVCGRSGNRLREVRICFSREGEFRTCGSNENQRKLCNSPRVYVPPVRQGRALPERDQGGPRLPGPPPRGGREL